MYCCRISRTRLWPQICGLNSLGTTISSAGSPRSMEGSTCSTYLQTTSGDQTSCCITSEIAKSFPCLLTVLIKLFLKSKRQSSTTRVKSLIRKSYSILFTTWIKISWRLNRISFFLLFNHATLNIISRLFDKVSLFFVQKRSR